jgi:predicted ABC-class ATPase
MRPAETLRTQIRGLDNKDYGAYQSIRGEYRFPVFDLVVTQIPKDPYAPPYTGIYRMRLSHEYLKVPRSLFQGKVAGTAYRDFLARRFSRACGQLGNKRRGTGYSGLISIDTPGQAILDRSSIEYTQDGIEVRFFVGLPANGRKINASLAEQMLLAEVPNIAAHAFSDIDIAGVQEHIFAAEDAEYLRSWLAGQGLVSFLADGALIPRESGVSDAPLDRDRSVLFHSPESLRASANLPHSGAITGMGIPVGVTLIVGGGYHGKSTLLRAIETGIYNHIPGDGRELCVTDARAVKVRAYSGRPVASVDISAFVDNLPFEKDTEHFSTENASGSTSQAASISEALEVEARALLMDEDTCAANLMVRDTRMQQLVRKEDEPITVYLDRVRWLYDAKGVSSILVLGGIGDYFDVADTVIQMKRFQPLDATSAAKGIAEESPVKRHFEHQEPSTRLAQRIVQTSCLDPRNEYGKQSVHVTETNRIRFGQTTVDLTDVEQIVELSQSKAIAQAILFCARLGTQSMTVREIADHCARVMQEKGLDGLCDRVSGHLAQFRDIELASALNRFPSLRVGDP